MTARAHIDKGNFAEEAGKGQQGNAPSSAEARHEAGLLRKHSVISQAVPNCIPARADLE